MIKKGAFVALVVAISLVFAVPAFAGGPPPVNEDGDRVRVQVYVTSQGLVYDSIVGPGLPQHGPFQQLFPPGTNPDWPELTTLSTEFGPGNPGYVGGRWWIDANGNGEMDEGDRFFSCPLLGKGSAVAP
jgi:hypothetical protein